MALSSLTAHRPTRHRKLWVALCLVMCAVCLLLDVGFAQLSQAIPTARIPPTKASSPAGPSWQRASFGLPAPRTPPLIHRPALTARHIHNLSFGKIFVSGQMISSCLMRVPVRDASAIRRDACAKARLFLNAQVVNTPLLI